MNQDANSLLDEGIRLLQAGDAQAARVRFDQAVQMNPTDGRAYGYLGITQVRLGDLSGGIGSLQEAERLQPGDSAASYNFSVALTQAQRVPEATAALERALTADPTNVKARAAFERLAGNSPTISAPPAAPVEAPELSGLASYNSIGSAGSPSPGLSSASYSPTPPLGMTPPPLPSLPMTGGVMPAPTVQGMHYNPQAAVPRVTALPPSSGLRVLRGLGWGAVYGQWWTIWNLFWYVFWGGLRSGGHISTMGMVILAVIMALIFGFVGSITGLIIGAADAHPAQGATIGIVAGLVLCGLETWMAGSASMLINLFFWFVTGRYVGAKIAVSVQRPVQQ